MYRGYGSSWDKILTQVLYKEIVLRSLSFVVKIRYSLSIILPIELPLVPIYILTLSNEGVVDSELVLINEVIDVIYRYQRM